MKTHHYCISSRQNSRCPSAPLDKLNCDRAKLDPVAFSGSHVMAPERRNCNALHRVYPIGHRPRGVEFHRGKLCWIVED